MANTRAKTKKEVHMILGIDEVGRGPIAGPLVIGAVLLKDFTDPKTGQSIESEDWQWYLDDSKKLSDKRRHELDKQIRAHAPGIGLGWVTNQEIDKIGISEALNLATRRAVNDLAAYMHEYNRHEEADEIVIDGPINFLKGTPLESRVNNLNKADSLIKSVSAASIVAKVARDDYMKDVVAKECPGYGFEKHVGYGTQKHLAAIRELGPCKYHRLKNKIFTPPRELKAYRERIKNANQPAPLSRPKTPGAQAERAVADFLVNQKGHRLIAMNFRTRQCEIDVITEDGNDLYFTEVKYRKNAAHGSPKDFITPQKLDQMRFAAETYFHSRPYLTKNPHLAAASVLGRFDNIDWFPLD